MKDLSRRSFMLATAAGVAACASVPTVAPAAPRVDHHQHIFSPAMAQMLSSGRPFPSIDGRALVGFLDEAGIQRAVALSVAYLFASASRNFTDELDRVRAENDWTASQVALHPQRLVGFGSVNPLKDWAIGEINRISRIPQLRRGLKLHLGNADVQLDEPSHVEQLRHVFAAANRHGMAITVHIRANHSRQRPYGAAQARIFLEQVVPAAPDVVIQVAHLAGSGPGYEDPPSDAAMAVLAEAAERRDPRTRQLWFDVASNVNVEITPEKAALVARRLRQVGMDRVLYGSDSAAGGNLKPREAWAAFRRLPLTAAEFARIASNVAPYLRGA